MSVEFTSTISGASWLLTNVYAPCDPDGRQLFLAWLSVIVMPADTYWLLLGDFNVTRKPSDRNKLGDSVRDMLSFNAAISSLHLEELKLFGNKST
jgi:hypothetical protein